jgi:hypothetical protein
MRISKILIALSATKDASVSMLDAFQMIRGDAPSVKVLLISYLSDLFKKSLGPNTLNHWVKEEKECVERVDHFFARMSIPCERKVITVPPWEMVFHEMSEEAQDLIILQSEFLEKWQKGKANCTLCSRVLPRSGSSLLLINSSDDTRNLPFPADSHFP